MKPDHLGHVHLKVNNLEKAQDFYTKIFGLKVTEKINDEFIFLSLGKHHHDVALMNVKNAPNPPEFATGLFHFAFEVKNMKEFAKFYKKLRKNNLPISTVDYGISKAMYTEDPSKNIVEIYVDTRSKVKEWKGKTKLLMEEVILKHLED